MSERYWITGVQLGMLKAFALDGGMGNESGEIVDKIIDEQFLGKSQDFSLSSSDTKSQHAEIKKSIDEDFAKGKEGESHD